MRFVGCHVFAGGFSLGMVQEGGELIAHLEGDDAYCHEDAEFNLGATVLRPGEWSQVAPGNLDVLVANPPCAPWSQAGNSLGSNDKRVSCVTDVISNVIRLRPTLVAIESVPNAWKRGREFWEAQADKLNDEGYDVVHWLHNTGNLGGLQNRKRYLLLASLREIPNVMLTARLPGPRALSDVRDEMSACVAGPRFEYKDPGQSGLFDAVIPEVPQGKKVREVWERMYGLPACAFLARRLAWDEMSPVVMHCFLVHPTEHRCVTLGELKLLCGFPQTWETRVKAKHIETHMVRMTRGVDPALGRHVARIHNNLGAAITTPSQRVVDTLELTVD